MFHIATICVEDLSRVLILAIHSYKLEFLCAPEVPVRNSTEQITVLQWDHYISCAAARESGYYIKLKHTSHYVRRKSSAISK